MGAATMTQQQQPTTTATAAPAQRPKRPGLVTRSSVTANNRSISYRSKSGRTLTFEFKPTTAIVNEKSRTAPAKESSVQIVSTDTSLPKKTSIVVTAMEDDQNQGVLLGVFDTISFWCMEAVEIALHGPYDEAPGK